MHIYPWQIYPPDRQTGGQEQYYIKTALHIICSFPCMLLER